MHFGSYFFLIILASITSFLIGQASRPWERENYYNGEHAKDCCLDCGSTWLNNPHDVSKESVSRNLNNTPNSTQAPDEPALQEQPPPETPSVVPSFFRIGSSDPPSLSAKRQPMTIHFAITESGDLSGPFASAAVRQRRSSIGNKPSSIDNKDCRIAESCNPWQQTQQN